jgi:hypothetical protein
MYKRNKDNLREHKIIAFPINSKDKQIVNVEFNGLFKVVDQ